MSMETQAITRVKIIVVKLGRRCRNGQQSGESTDGKGTRLRKSRASRHVAFPISTRGRVHVVVSPLPLWGLSQNCTEPFPSLTLFFLPFPPTADPPANDTDNNGMSLPPVDASSQIS